MFYRLFPLCHPDLLSHSTIAALSLAPSMYLLGPDVFFSAGAQKSRKDVCLERWSDVNGLGETHLMRAAILRASRCWSPSPSSSCKLLLASTSRCGRNLGERGLLCGLLLLAISFAGTCSCWVQFPGATPFISRVCFLPKPWSDWASSRPSLIINAIFSCRWCSLQNLSKGVAGLPSIWEGGRWTLVQIPSTPLCDTSS